MRLLFHVFQEPVRRYIVVCMVVTAGFWMNPELGVAQDATNADVTPPALGSPLTVSVDFNRDIRPLFSRSCAGCHGGVKQAGEISFAAPSTILPPGGWVIEPGRPDESRLIEVISATDAEERMPPPGKHSIPLSADEVVLIRKWIRAGAKWPSHWSRAPLVQALVPMSPESTAWSKTELDHFVWNNLQQNSLHPSDEAHPGEWLRRVTFDLIGLPPDPTELISFREQIAAANLVADREFVYAAQVDRLLKSPRFGERWASMWLDLARYADSQGFEKDPHRDIWPYRDWLIDAFNRDIPFDEFTIQQLAGDLRPGRTYEDIVASAFHRNTQTNTEGGTDDEEYRVAAVVDRLNTTWTVWQATSISCVQCHAHPYDPYEHNDFYRGLALFDNTEDADLASDFPTIPFLAEADQRADFLRTETERQAIERRIDEIGREVVEAAKWSPLPVTRVSSTSGELIERGDEIVVAGGTVASGSEYRIESNVRSVTSLRLTIIPDSEDPTARPELGSVVSQLRLEVLSSEDGSVDESTRKTASPNPPIEPDAVIPDGRGGPFRCEEMLIPGPAGFGGYPRLLRRRWVVVTMAKPLQLQPNESLEIRLVQQATVSGGISNHLRRFNLEFSTDGSLIEAIRRQDYQQLRARRGELDKARQAFSGPSLPVMRQRPPESSRTTRQFLRGNWLERGEVVAPGIPAVFQPKDGPDITVTDRLEFAKWLVSARNPLTARVWTNRIWAELFSTGIVEALEDFGAASGPPSHPLLLDFLAHETQFDLKWHLKPLLKTIVLSATYRQDARATPRLRKRDPRNRLLARGPRTRLTAEMIRDQALFVSGKMSTRVGGPAVMPPQPDGVWQQAYSGAKWRTAIGPDRYRRGIYTYWKRTSPYPESIVFDAPPRDVCSPRRMVTNTPLQSLAALNSLVYTELATAIAQRCLSAANGNIDRATEDMFLRLTSREAAPDEVRQLRQLYERQSESKAANSSDKNSQHLAVDSLSVVALAIMNCDWTLTK